MDQFFTTSGLSLLAILLPFISFIFILLFSPKGKGAYIAITAIALSFILSLFIFLRIWNQEVVHRQIHWFSIGAISWDIGILLNNLSVLMLPLVSGVALLVHIYSTAYMKGDENLHRYWAYLSLFCFSMLGLVVADNLLLVYMFWELVGVSSYLLIGFWFTREAAVQANKKAFIMNRIGDLGFLIAIMVLFTQFQTLDIQKIFGGHGLLQLSVFENGLWISGTHQLSYGWLIAAGLGFVFGAVAKSAQFPLHTWLPDAMEGPTSVSSLIHAATMVAAGVFLLVRVSPVFDHYVLSLITGIGIVTAFMAATIALVQNDIKKILAFSTISQLGFMMLAIGMGENGAAMFHLTTHAFFKCLLFLCAGAVIHEMHHLKDKTGADFDHQDIRNMGGLGKAMPLTFISMVIASMALSGIPLTAGYLSKDAILISSFEWASARNGIARIVPYLAMLTSWLTTFYISRLIFKVFFGKLRVNYQEGYRLHDGPLPMCIPLAILAAFSVFLFFSVNPLVYEDVWLIRGFPLSETLERVNILHTIIPAILNLLAVFIVYIAYLQYARRKIPVFSTGTFLYRFAVNGWYLDYIYLRFLVNPLVAFSRLSFTFDRKIVDGLVESFSKAGLLLAVIADWFDRKIVDGLVSLAVSISRITGDLVRSFQSGRLQHYLLVMLFLVLTFFVLRYFSPAI